MRPRNMFTGFAASYFTLVLLKNGTLLKLTRDASKGAQDLVRGIRVITRIA